MAPQSSSSRKLSRLFSSRHRGHQSATDTLSRHWLYRLVRFFMVVAIILSALWLLSAIWYQFGATSRTTSIVVWLAIAVILSWLTALIVMMYWPTLFKKLSDKIPNKTASRLITHKRASKWLIGGYLGIWLLSLGWFFSIEPSSDLNWQSDVSQVLSYTRDINNPNLVTFYNVRNFDWYIVDDGANDSSASEVSYLNSDANLTNDDKVNKTSADVEIASTARWETRTVDMSKLSGVDVSNSYWMGPLIAHTLVSFRFEDDRPLAFSFEIRKEADEKFSAFAGFFRRFELSLIAAEERDILYTRSNVRGEQLYLFPISHLQHSEVTSLFESYLSAADELQAKPAWYNTLTSNCTNIIFYMARLVSGDRLPWDYRIWVSGWLPNYLFDIGMLDGNTTEQGQPWSIDTWYERTHVNPKVMGFNNQINVENQQNSRDFSEQIRKGLVIPPLDDSKLDAERGAQSAAVASNE